MVDAATVTGPFINQLVCPVLSFGLPAHASLFHGFTLHYLYSPHKQYSEWLSAHCHFTQNIFHSCPFLFVYGALSLSWTSLWSLSCGKKLTDPCSGAQHSCVWSDHAWPPDHTSSVWWPSLGMKLTPTLPTCLATKKPVCSMYCTLAHPSTRETTLGICYPEPCGVHGSM